MPESGDQSLKFATSFDMENPWDFFFVEIRDAQGNWTRLPDANGHTTQATGESCHTDAGWAELHPQLLHYQTKSGGTCTPTGTTGEWNAATGSSGGWQRNSLNEPENHNQATWGDPTTQSFEEGAVLGTKDLQFVTGSAYAPTEYQSTETRDTVFAGFELGTLPSADRTAFFEEVLEYFGMKPPDGE